MGKSYDIGLPIDLQDRIARLAELLGASISKVAHALIRESLVKITSADEAREWWRKTPKKA